MASEIVVSATVNFTLSTIARSFGVPSLIRNMTGTRWYAGVQDIGTAAHELVALGADLGTAGYAFFRNLDAANYVELGIDVPAATAFASLAKLKFGDVALVPLATKTVYAKANTAAVKLEFWVLEE